MADLKLENTGDDGDLLPFGGGTDWRENANAPHAIQEKPAGDR